jgi:hypothetical protein
MTLISSPSERLTAKRGKLETDESLESETMHPRTRGRGPARGDRTPFEPGPDRLDHPQILERPRNCLLNVTPLRIWVRSFDAFPSFRDISHWQK